MHKGVVNYYFKTQELPDKIWGTIHDRMNDLSLKQLETLIWSISKRPEQDVIDHTETVNLLIKKVAAKSASMKARGISFAVEAIANLH
jgi:hypothetical protein